MALTVPPPRTASPAERGGRADGPSRDAWARWYEEELGWATAGSAPVRLLTGLRFDALVVPRPRVTRRCGGWAGPVL